MEKEFQLTSFDEDDFDLESHKKIANAHARAIAHADRVRRQVSIAKVVLIIMLFAAGFCIYYLANDLIARYDYNKYHSMGAKR
jgi:hypothetical protein